MVRQTRVPAMQTAHDRDAREIRSKFQQSNLTENVAKKENQPNPKESVSTNTKETQTIETMESPIPIPPQIKQLLCDIENFLVDEDAFKARREKALHKLAELTGTIKYMPIKPNLKSFKRKKYKKKVKRNYNKTWFRNSNIKTM